MDSRIDRLKRRLKELPERPGVYLHKNSAGEVIYVGKARNLRNRVNSYLVGKGLRDPRSEEHTSELQSLRHLVCRLLLEKKKKKQTQKSDGIEVPSTEVTHP